MFNKLYANFTKNYKVKIKSFFKWFLIVLVLTIHLPFYINVPGGLINISNRIKINNKHVSDLYNMTYVSEFKATIPTILWSLFNNNWDILKKGEVILKNETIKDVEFRNQLLLDEANQTAIYVAFNLANKDIEIYNNKVYVVFIGEDSKTNLNIGDQIISVDNKNINAKKDIQLILNNKKVDDIVHFTVLNNNQEIKKTAKLYNYNQKAIAGIVLSEIKEMKTDYDIQFDFKNSESGPSGGFMMALSIYDYLIGGINHNYKIAGTGSIDNDGNVGSIGGIKYKVLGAVKEKVDIFFVPAGENYDEAIKIVNDKNLNLKIVKINNIKDAIYYLNNSV